MKQQAGRRSRIAIAIVAAFALVMALAAGASAKDRNHDNLPDKWEKKHHLSLNHKQGKRDQDSDSLRNRGEFKAGTDPRDADSDDDGIEDGDEDAGTIESFDASTGVLVINLFNGDSVSGTVTDDTEIECENDDVDDPEDIGDDHGDDGPDHDVGDDNGDDSLKARDGGSGDDDTADDEDNSGPSDNSGPGENSGPGDGDDQGEDNDDQGEDEDECSTADLVPGATVEEATLIATADGLVYEEVELRK